MLNFLGIFVISFLSYDLKFRRLCQSVNFREEGNTKTKIISFRLARETMISIAFSIDRPFYEPVEVKLSSHLYEEEIIQLIVPRNRKLGKTVMIQKPDERFCLYYIEDHEAEGIDLFRTGIHHNIASTVLRTKSLIEVNERRRLYGKAFLTREKRIDGNEKEWLLSDMTLCDYEEIFTRCVKLKQSTT
jgi:hypothetical protein